MMSFDVYDDSIIYIVSPPNAATGGPEALHQVAFFLRKHYKDRVFMHYLPSNTDKPIHPHYTKFNIPYSRKIEDNKKNIIIVPEVINCLTILENFKHIRKAIWWLSTDNFPLSIWMGYDKNPFFKRVLRRIGLILLSKQIFDFKEIFYRNNEDVTISFGRQFKEYPWLSKVDVHLANADYTFQTLKNTVDLDSPPVQMLNEFIGEQFVNDDVKLEEKKNLVAYNPLKGIAFHKKLIKACPEVKFVPITGMLPEQVQALLKSAKVYIDFGTHPGRERIPREAASQFCCVIVGMRGSAGYEKDVAVPNEYKFRASDSLENIKAVIQNCFDNYKEVIDDFSEYREIIKNDKMLFEKRLSKLFSLRK